MDNLPNMAYVAVRTANQIGIVKKGEKGYFKIPQPEMQGKSLSIRVAELNQEIGISMETGLEMEARSLNGNW